MHQKCYGVGELPVGDWVCRSCALFSPERARLLRCVLCSVRGGAMRQTNMRSDSPQLQAHKNCRKSGKEEFEPEFVWVHLSCAYWLPELKFCVTPTADPALHLDLINKTRTKLLCSICKERNVGYCIQCVKGKCQTSFHVECARIGGLPMESAGEGEEARKVAYCERHRPLELVKAIEQEKRQAEDEIATFCRITKKCLESGERRQARKVFGKADRKILLKRIRKVCRSFAAMSIRIRRIPDQAGNTGYRVVQTPGRIDYKDTLDRTRFPWNSVKFDEFSAISCYRKYVELIPDEAAFVKEITREPKPHAQQEATISRPGAHQLLAGVDTTRYCYCKKMEHEVQGAHMIGTG